MCDKTRASVVLPRYYRIVCLLSYFVGSKANPKETYPYEYHANSLVMVKPLAERFCCCEDCEEYCKQ